MGVPHVWSCNCLSVRCYFWFLFMISLFLHSVSPPPPPASFSSHSFTLMFSLLSSPLTKLCVPSISDLHRKRHRSCDSEEDQQLSPQAKRSGGGPSLLVSDLDSEVRLTWCFRSSLDHRTDIVPDLIRLLERKSVSAKVIYVFIDLTM